MAGGHLSSERTTLQRLGHFGAHVQNPIDLPSLLDEEAPRCDVAVHHTGRLQLHPLRCLNPAPHFPADDRLAREDVPLHHAPLSDQHLARRAYRSNDRALDLHDAVGRHVSLHAHPGADDRQPGLRLRSRVLLLREDRHVNSPLSRPSGGRATGPRVESRNAGGAPWSDPSCPSGRSPDPPVHALLRLPVASRRAHTWSHTPRGAARGRTTRNRDRCPQPPPFRLRPPAPPFPPAPRCRCPDAILRDRRAALGPASRIPSRRAASGSAPRAPAHSAVRRLAPEPTRRWRASIPPRSPPPWPSPPPPPPPTPPPPPAPPPPPPPTPPPPPPPPCSRPPPAAARPAPPGARRLGRA